MNEQIKSIKKKIETLLEKKIVKIKLIHKGNNSTVYRIQADTRLECIVKKYPSYINDTRNRLSNEVSTLGILNRYLKVNVPQVIRWSVKDNLGVYSYIKGKKITKNNINKNVVVQSIKFIKDIQNLRQKPDIDKINYASEACLSIKDYHKIISKRLINLRRALTNNYYDALCNTFIKNRVIPWYQKINDISNQRNNLNILSVKKKYQILSPSDFGFHNMILEKNELFFTDFEYFGWDDPAKFICDFYLQPDMPLPDEYREYYLREIEKVVDDPDLIQRLYMVYLYTGIKWILIMLNPFVRKDKNNKLKLQRIKKCNKYLDKIINEYEKQMFPLTIK